MEYPNFRAGFELNEADMQLQWQFAAYVRRVIRTARRDYVAYLTRTQDHEVPLSDELLACTGTSDFVEQVADRDLLRRHIHSLTERQKQVIWAVYQEGFSLSETAAMLGLTPARVSQLRTQALKKLRRQISGEGSD